MHWQVATSLEDVVHTALLNLQPKAHCSNCFVSQKNLKKVLKKEEEEHRATCKRSNKRTIVSLNDRVTIRLDDLCSNL